MTDDLTETSRSTGSPCVRNCCLDDEDICFGCHRSLAEIVGWSAASESEKRAILARCTIRWEHAKRHFEILRSNDGQNDGH